MENSEGLGLPPDCYPAGVLEFTAMRGVFFALRANSSGEIIERAMRVIRVEIEPPCSGFLAGIIERFEPR